MNSDILLLRDVVKIAKYLQWQTQVGEDIAHALIDQIHAGKYGSKNGVWIQAEYALKRLENSLT